MPTLPTKSLFDKDLSLRSPFPRHVSTFPQIPPDRSISSSFNSEARIGTARPDYSQIKRPTPVKPKTAMSVFDLQLPQADAPQVARTMTTFHKPQPLKWSTADRQLDRMYLASPMPKIIDQTYSSLTTASQRQNATQFTPLDQPAKVIPTIPKPLSPRTTEPVSGQWQISSPSNSMSRELESTTPSASETPAKVRAVELELEPESSSTLAPFSDALDILDMGKDKSSNKISNESNPRKRKSDFKERKRVVESRKSNKRRRLFKRSEPKAPGPEVPATSSPAPAEVDALPIQELQKEYKHSNIKQPKESNSRSKVNRIRSSVSQFFKGSIWEPPASSTRTRRPPSQWWVPSGSYTKRKRKSGEVILGQTKTSSPTLDTTYSLKRSEDKGYENKKVNSSAVRKTVSKEIYEFSD